MMTLEYSRVAIMLALNPVGGNRRKNWYLVLSLYNRDISVHIIDRHIAVLSALCFRSN